MSREDSGREHLCSQEVSRGSLRPSLEETLAFNRSKSVGEVRVRVRSEERRVGKECVP